MTRVVLIALTLLGPTAAPAAAQLATADVEQPAAVRAVDPDVSTSPAPLALGALSRTLQPAARAQPPREANNPRRRGSIALRYRCLCLSREFGRGGTLKRFPAQGDELSGNWVRRRKHRQRGLNIDLVLALYRE